MKVVFSCVICGSSDLAKKLGQFAPFVAHRFFDYPICEVSFGGASVYPPTLTNAMLCRNCGFVFSQMRPDPDEMARLYAGYRGAAYTEEREAYEPGYASVNPLIGLGAVEIEARQRAMAEFLGESPRLKSVRRVLDYGGDRGQHIPAMFSACERMVYDISGYDAVPGVRMVPSLKGIGDVDFVMLSNALEHVSYPASLLGEALSIAASDAHLFIDVPLEMHPAASEDDIPSYFHEHINFFDPRSLTSLIEVVGLTVEKITVVEMDLGWSACRSIFALAAKAA